MKIDTKFSPEDYVFILHSGHIVQGKIKKIKIDVSFEGNSYDYWLLIPHRKTYIILNENNIFKTSDLLVERLQKDVISYKDKTNAD